MSGLFERLVAQALRGGDARAVRPLAPVDLLAEREQRVETAPRGTGADEAASDVHAPGAPSGRTDAADTTRAASVEGGQRGEPASRDGAGRSPASRRARSMPIDSADEDAPLFSAARPERALHVGGEVSSGTGASASAGGTPAPTTARPEAAAALSATLGQLSAERARAAPPLPNVGARAGNADLDGDAGERRDSGPDADDSSSGQAAPDLDPELARAVRRSVPASHLPGGEGRPVVRVSIGRIDVRAVAAPPAAAARERPARRAVATAPGAPSLGDYLQSRERERR